MKHYPRIEMDAGGNHDFPRLARESGFYFNLYRGRVDWKQIDLLDIDRLIRERDLESLQSAFVSIASCTLTNEYDVKVLDPNFVKLFRLAQLSVDYLQYCRNYLDHCVIVLQEQLQVALHEVEQLQQERQVKEDEIKQLTKKLKAKGKPLGNNGLIVNAADYGTAVPGISQSSCRCIPCGKMFVNTMFLERHVMRRHPEQVKLNNEAEKLRLEVHQLQERLQKAEELLKQSSNQVETKNAGTASTDEVGNVDKHAKLEKVDKAQNTDDNLNQLKQTSDTEKRSEQSEENMRALMESVKRQSEEIESLKNQLKTQHFAHDSLWQTRLDQLERKHLTDIDALRSSLLQPSGLTMQPANQSFNFKELHEKQVQISRPEMVVTATQVESLPDRPQPLQEAFTKPTPNHFTTSPKQSHHRVLWNDQMKTESSKPVRNHLSLKERPASTQQTRQPQMTEHSEPSTSGSQQYSRMSGDLSTTESSTEESSQSSMQANSPMKDDSETEESSTTTEDGMKMLSSLANKPQVLAPLRNDIEDVMCRFLRQLGIDPEWKGIPTATYQSVKATLQHQRSIAQKDRQDLVKLRENLSREVDNRTKKVLSAGSPQKEKTPVRKVPVRPPPPRSSPSNKLGNEYTAEPRRERSVKPAVVYEEVKNKDVNSSTQKRDEQEAPLPPTRRRSVEKSPVPPNKLPAPIPPPRVTPTTAELLADMEKLRQQGTLLKSEASSMTKSNLKSSSSTGNVAKKRVVFLDEKDDFSAVEIGLNDSEFGMFQTSNPANVNLNYSNKAHNFSASSVSRDATSDLNSLSNFRNGSGEPVRPEGETNVVRIAREIERQLLNKPNLPSSQLPRSYDHRNDQSDLIVDDLSSS